MIRPTAKLHVGSFELDNDLIIDNDEIADEDI